ncbi:rhodanese-like domain-containing protein [Aequorivita antarctica]|uniref:Rhodanese-like domain-containing protein n=1 Tax=Aequorivita antarctica TaxID=153266 RepID=A0A5C6YYE5_9FLAO|nr:rhodanese-like domain-containing protein [Aequorivita antarctica]TXD72281.1 rhodanese-like domain-containing protein [Aequorivita antarctica]
MKHKAIIFFLFFIAANGFAQKNLDELLQKHNVQSIPYILVEELQMFQLNDTVTILDAREPEEFNVSHLKSAINVGFNDFSSEEKQLQNINKDAQIIIYCSLGIRSEKIGEKLEKAGFTNVKNLYGGIFEWKKKGYPVIDSIGEETENVHAFSKHWSKYLQAGNPVY